MPRHRPTEPHTTAPRRWRLVFAVLGVALALSGSPVGAAAADDPGPARLDRLKAVFMYQFTEYIDWPEADPGAAPFVVGVVGATPVAAVLEEIAARRTVRGRRIEVRQWPAVAAIGPCHMLFVAPDAGLQLPEVLRRITGTATLTVGDQPGLARRGVCINFVVIAGKMKFELNRRCTQNAGLRVSSQLLKLARIVEDTP